MNPLLKRPSAWIPIVLSLGIIAMLLVLLSINGVPTELPQDEGTAAHLFQIWLALEVGLIGFFAAKWLPRAPKEAAVILGIQILLVLAGMSPVWYFQL